MKRVLFIGLLFSVSFSFAQQKESANQNPFSISCDLVSRYVWRGAQLSDSPNVQPGLEYTNKGFSIGAWGSYALNLTGAQEADFYLGYAIDEQFSVTLTDYFFPNADTDYRYFDYNQDSTGHILEASVSYNGTDRIPLKIMLATNFYGADARKIKEDGTPGNIMYSTYAEMTYSFKYLDAFLGANLTNVDSDKGEYGFYGDSIGLVNLGISTSKSIKITDSFELPLSMSIITNPQAEKIYFIAGLSF